MILEYVSATSDEVLDVITVGDDVTYSTGKARGIFERWTERSGSPAKAAADLDGWSNGYAVIRRRT